MPFPFCLLSILILPLWTTRSAKLGWCRAPEFCHLGDWIQRPWAGAPCACEADSEEGANMLYGTFATLPGWWKGLMSLQCNLRITMEMLGAKQSCSLVMWYIQPGCAPEKNRCSYEITIACTLKHSEWTFPSICGLQKLARIIWDRWIGWTVQSYVGILSNKSQCVQWGLLSGTYIYRIASLVFTEEMSADNICSDFFLQPSVYAPAIS